MAFGDVGGAVTELIVTCRTSEVNRAVIAKGDAVVLVGGYEVDLSHMPERRIFGQAMDDATNFAEAVPVKTRGICVFAYTGTIAPTVDGEHGVVASCAEPGLVVAPVAGYGHGINLKVDTEKSEVHVLL